MANNVIGLDIGERRIGVARVNLTVKLPEALCSIENTDLFIEKLKDLIEQHETDALVVGLPRSLNGQETTQSNYARDFAESKLKPLGLEIIWQDETLSSVEAEKRLFGQKQPKHDVDSVSAVIILEDYIKGL
jgi:putative Holliday junction resolvase